MMTKIANVKPSPRSQVVNFGDRNDAEITYASEAKGELRVLPELLDNSPAGCPTTAPA